MQKTAKIEIGENNPILRDKSKHVKRVDGVLVEDLKHTMLAEKGLGLAAPQIGVNERVFVMKFLRGEMAHQKDETSAEGENIQDYVLLECVNPEIVDRSEEMEIGEEGCLSLPKVYGNVARDNWILVKFQDRYGKEKTLEMEGLNARIFQHELDHLDGILFIDRMEK